MNSEKKVSNESAMKELMGKCNFQTDPELEGFDTDMTTTVAYKSDAPTFFQNATFDGIRLQELADEELESALKQIREVKIIDTCYAKSIIDNSPTVKNLELPKGRLNSELLLNYLRNFADYRSFNGSVYVKSSSDSCYFALTNEHDMQTYLVHLLSQNNEAAAHSLLTRISIAKSKKVFNCAKNNPFAIASGKQFENDGCAILTSNGAYIVKNGDVNYVTTKNCKEKGLFFTYRANAAFDLNARHEAWDKFLSTFIGKKKADHKRFWQIMGNLIFTNPSAKVFVIMHGNGNDGKSMLCRVIKQIFGTPPAVCDSDSHTAFSEFGKSSFKDAKILFLHELNDELSQRTIDELKRLTGADGSTVNRKLRDMIGALLKVKILITCNHLPRFALGTIDKALLNRLQFIKVFAPDKKSEDKDLADKLFEERDFFLTKSVIGFAQLQKQNYQFEASDKDKELENAVLKANPAVAFIADCCIEDPKSYMKAAEFKIAVKKWAKEALEKVRLKDMKEALKNLGFEFGKISSGHDRNKYAFFGLRLKTEDEYN